MQDKNAFNTFMYTSAFIFIRIFHFFKIICIEYDVLNARFKYCPLTEGIRVERSRILHADTLDNFSLISCQDYGTFLL